MRSRDDELHWIPLWVDKYLFGSTRIELKPDERSVWMDLMVLSAKDSGCVQANIGVPYPIPLLAGMFNVKKELLTRTIERCKAVGKITENEDGTLFLPNWQEYQLSPRHKRRFASEKAPMSAKEDATSAKEDISSSSADTILEKSILENKKICVHPTSNFQRFWEAYPKKRSKGQAEKAFSKINPDEQLLETMISTIERATKSEDWIKEKGKFIPHPATWLNAKGWEDEPTETKPEIDGDYPKAEDVLKRQGFGPDVLGIGKSWENA
jgi:hypothetical protein